MRHQKKTIKLGRTAEHRKALLANQVCSLIEHQRIKTTLAKAKAVRPLAEKMVTLGKKRINSCAPDCLGDIAAKERREETLRRHRAEIDGAQRRLHAHCEARPTQERLRRHGVHRVGRCSTSHRGKNRGGKEGQAKRGRAKRKTKRTRFATRRTSDQRRRTGGATCGRAEAEKAEMVRQKIGGAGKIISHSVRNRPERLVVQRGHRLFKRAFCRFFESADV